MNITQQKKLTSLLNTIVVFLMIISCSFFILSIIDISDIQFAAIGYAFVLGIICAGLIAFTIIHATKIVKTDRAAVIFILALSLVTLFIWNYKVQPIPVSDYDVLWRGAKQIADGTFAERSIKKDDYFCFYNFQIGYAWWLSLGIRVFHGRLVAARAVEIVIVSLTNIVIYKSLRLYSGLRTSLCGATLFLAYPFIFMGSGILNNQHISMLFEAIAIYLFLKNIKGENRMYIWAFVSLFLYFAEFMRPTATIVFIAIVIVSILLAIINKDKRCMYGLVILIAIYIMLSNLVNYAFVASGLAPYGLKISNLWFKLSLGLTGEGITHQATVDAEHTNLYFDLKYYGFDYDAYKINAKNYLMHLISSHSLNMEFIWNKIIYYAGAVDNQYGFTGSDSLARHPVVTNTLNMTGICIYAVTVLVTGIRCVKKDIINYAEILLPALVFLGYFAAYILFEAQTRYRYEQYYMLFLMSVPMMASLCTTVCKGRQKFER